MKTESGWRNGEWFSRGRGRSIIVYAGEDIKNILSEAYCGNPEWPGIEGAIP